MLILTDTKIKSENLSYGTQNMRIGKRASITDGVFAFGAMQVKRVEDVLC